MNVSQNGSIIYLSPDFDFGSLVSWVDVFTSLPPSIFSSITCFITIIVMAGLKDPISRFLLLISIADFLYVFLPIPEIVFLNWCSWMAPQCGSYTQYVASWYVYLDAYFFTSVCAIFSIVAEIFLSVQRLFVLNNKPYLKNASVTVVSTAIFIFSVLYCFSGLLFFKVEPTGLIYIYRDHSYIDYGLVLTSFGKSPGGNTLYIVIAVIRIFMVIVVMGVLNFLTILSFRAFVKRKSKLVKRTQSGGGENSAEDKASRNVTYMLISISFVYIFGNIVYRAYMIIRITQAKVDPVILRNLGYAGNFMIYLYPGLKIFVYFAFNPLFRVRFLAPVSMLKALV